MFNKSNNQSNWMNKFILVLACLSFIFSNTFVLIFLYFSFYFYIVIYSWKLVSYIYIFFLFLFYSILYLLQVFLKFTEHTNLYIIKLKNNILKKDIILTLVKILTFKIIFIIVCFSFNISYLSLNQIDTTGLAMITTGVTIIALAITIKHFKDLNTDLNKELLVQKKLLNDSEHNLAFANKMLKIYEKSRNKQFPLDSFKPKVDYTDNQIPDYIDKNNNYIQEKYNCDLLSMKDINKIRGQKVLENDIKDYNEQYHIELLHKVCETENVDMSDNFLLSNTLDSNDIVKILQQNDIKHIILNQNKNLINLNLLLNGDWEFEKGKIINNMQTGSDFENFLNKAKDNALSRVYDENMDKLEIIKCAIVDCMFNINKNIQIVNSDKTSIPLKLKYFPHVERDLETFYVVINNFIVSNNILGLSRSNAFENYLRFIDSLKSQCFYYHYAIKANADNIASGLKKSFSENDLQYLKKPAMEYQKDIVENIVNMGKDLAENNTTIFCYNFIIDFLSSTLGNFFPFLKHIPHIKDITDEKESSSSELKVNEEDFKELDNLHDSKNLDISKNNIKKDSVDSEVEINKEEKKNLSEKDLNISEVKQEENLQDLVQFRKKEDPSDNEFIENTP